MTTSPDAVVLISDVNLVDAAKNELQFLKQVDQQSNLFQGQAFQSALRRYELFWLPLFQGGDHDGKELQPPLDIEFIWQAHILDTATYEEDCINIVSRKVDHCIMTGHQRVQALERAKLLWQRTYPQEPFEADLQERSDYISQFHSKLQVNLVEACTWLRNFSYCVSLPHYNDTKFLISALQRYKQHLFLTSLEPKMTLVPCCDVDLIWKVHLLHPGIYKVDTEAIFGHVLKHPETRISHLEVSKYLASEKVTRGLFEEHGLVFCRSGAVYRGEAPAVSLVPSTDLYRPLAIFDFQLELLKFEVENFQKGKTFSFVLKQDNDKTVWKSRIKGGTHTLGDGQTPLSSFVVNNDDKNSITLSFHQKKFLFKSPQLCHTIDLKECLEATLKQDSITHEFKIPVPIFGPANRKVFVTIRTCPSPKLLGYRFTLDPGPEFAEFPHPAEVLSAPKTMLKREYLTMSKVPCELSVYRVYDCGGRPAFTCRLVHAGHSGLMVLEVVDFHGSTVASAQLVDNHLFPSRLDPLEDAANCVTTDPNENESFLLIRGHGDWGICIGLENVHEHPVGLDYGEYVLQVKFFKLAKNPGWCRVTKTENSLLLQTCPDDDTSIEVNPQLGQITLPPDTKDISECLALGLSLMLMPSLCNFASSPDGAIASDNAMENGFHLTSVVLRCPSLTRYSGSEVPDGEQPVGDV